MPTAERLRQLGHVLDGGQSLCRRKFREGDGVAEAGAARAEECGITWDLSTVRSIPGFQWSPPSLMQNLMGSSLATLMVANEPVSSKISRSGTLMGNFAPLASSSKKGRTSSALCSTMSSGNRISNL